MRIVCELKGRIRSDSLSPRVSGSILSIVQRQKINSEGCVTFIPHLQHSRD